MPNSQSLSQTAYQSIRQKLLDPGFCSDGRISESELAKELGISRTPVREAIRRLQSDGVVYQIPRKGTFIAQLDRNQIIEAYEVREALECMAVVKASKRMTPRQRMELRSLCDKMHAAIIPMKASKDAVLEGELLQHFLAADFEFHQLILRVANNQLALKFISDYHVRGRSHGQHSHHRDLHHVAWTWAAHVRIARAVQKRDARASRNWMMRHIRASLRDALAAFDEGLSLNNPGRHANSHISKPFVKDALPLSSSLPNSV